MTNIVKKELVDQVIEGIREYGISNVLFRHVVADRLGVNITDVECLGLLFHKGISTPGELSAHTGLSSGATTAMLDRLERSGIIQRQPNPSDRRGTLIAINEEKAEALAPFFTSGREAQFNLISGYGQDELTFLADFLHKLAAMQDQERRRMQADVGKVAVRE